MQKLPSNLLSVCMAVNVALVLAFVFQPTNAEAWTKKNSHPQPAHSKATFKSNHPGVRTPSQHAKAAGKGKHKTTAHPAAHPVKSVHGVGLPRNARSIPAVMRTRRGALAAARRRAHAGDATMRGWQKVRLAMPAPLFGSHESLVHQNEMVEADGLERILDDDDLNNRIASGSLVPVPVSGTLRINPDLPENRRYCRPWTAKFLNDLAHAHTSKFAGSALDVTSAVRTVEYQRHLRFTNGNAASADGDIASPHLTGGTIDIAKQGLTSREIGWLRTWLIPLEQQGKIDVEEEFRQSCFHISVYKNYLASTTSAPVEKPSSPLASGSMLAAHGR